MQLNNPIIIMLIIFAVLLLIFFLVFPEYKAFQNLRLELSEKKAEYDAKFDYYAAITKAYDELQSRPDGLEKVNNALPPSPELGNIVYFLQQVASENSIILKDLFLTKTTTAKSQNKDEAVVKNITLTLDLIGNYSAMQKFAGALERSARLFEVTSITFGTAMQISAQSESETKNTTQAQTQQTNNFSMQIETHSY